MATQGKTAKRYAKALFEVCQVDELDRVQDSLEQLSEIWNNSLDLQQACLNPAISPEAKSAVLAEIAEKIWPAEKRLVNFLFILVRNKRVSILPDITLVFTEMVRELRKAMNVQITSAFDISDEEKSSIENKLKQQFGDMASVAWDVDPELLGGLRIQSGDKLLDASVLGSLEKFRSQLTQ